MLSAGVHFNFVFITGGNSPISFYKDNGGID